MAGKFRQTLAYEEGQAFLTPSDSEIKRQDINKALRSNPLYQTFRRLKQENELAHVPADAWCAFGETVEPRLLLHDTVLPRLRKTIDNLFPGQDIFIIRFDETAFSFYSGQEPDRQQWNQDVLRQIRIEPVPPEFVIALNQLFLLEQETHQSNKVQNDRQLTEVR